MAEEFAKFDELLGLYEAGRANAALAAWEALPQQFRVRVMKFVVYVQEHPEFHADAPAVVLVTPFGEWRMDADKLHRVVKAVGAIVSAKHS